MSATERLKGARGELEVRDLLHRHGYDQAHRNFGSGSQGHGDIAYAIPGVHIEVKRCERAEVWKWWHQANTEAGPDTLPVVAFRRNKSPWLALVEFDELLALLAFREKAA